TSASVVGSGTADVSGALGGSSTGLPPMRATSVAVTATGAPSRVGGEAVVSGARSAMTVRMVCTEATSWRDGIPGAVNEVSLQGGEGRTEPWKAGVDTGP